LSQKNAPTLKPYSSIITRIYFDGIWQKYSSDSRIEFACISFHVILLFINFSSFKPDTENSANLDTVSSKHTNFDDVQFFETYT